jgi:hypothetical protein
MAQISTILKSFAVKDTLNPKVWENPEDGVKATLKPKVKDALIRIADDFQSVLGDDVKVQDVVLTGSLSNYNWSEFSDFDLHLIIDYKQFGKQAQLYRDLFGLKKQVYNIVKQYKNENIDALEVRELIDFISDPPCVGLMEEGISLYNEEGITFYENLNVLARHENTGTDDIFEAAKLCGAELDADWYSCDYVGNIESLTEKELKTKLIEFINKNIKKEN